MSDWYSLGFRIAAARDTDVIASLNASVTLTTLLKCKPKAWQTFFTTDKIFKAAF